MNKQHILIADDDAAIVAALHVLLNQEGYETSTAQSVEEVKFIASKKDIDLILLDMNFQLDTTSGQEGLEILGFLKEKNIRVPVVAMTGWSSIELSVAAMQLGAGDFIEKPWDNERLLSVVRNQIRLAATEQAKEKLHQENDLLRESAEQRDVPFVAHSDTMQQLLASLEQVALSDLSILLYGENGTGKSKIAAEIHQKSPRSAAPFITVNMGAIPESLFESEMFGHVKGAFTDAKQDRAGRFELAAGGTLFLDEVANIPLSQQAKLLRVLETKEFERVGGTKTQWADVRIVCATNADLKAMCDAGEFRRDLMFRLAGFEFTLPALRDRADDILPLANDMLARFAQKYSKPNLVFSQQAEAALCRYDWPGNIRELQHCIERAVVLTAGEKVSAESLRLVEDSHAPASGTDAVQAALLTLAKSDLTLDDIERSCIEERLAKHDGQVVEVAESLGLSRSAFYRRLEKYQIETKS